MRTRLAGVLALALTAASVASAEQAHEAAPKSTPAGHGTPAAGQILPTPEATEHAAPAKKVPTVSRIVPKPTAGDHAEPAHAAAPAAPASAATATAAPSPSPSPAEAHGGYVATSARPKSAPATNHAAKATSKPKPVVSGLAPRPTAQAEHAAPHASSAHSKAQAKPVHDAPPEHAPAAEGASAPPAASTRPAVRGLARLSDVHERIAAALASLREDASHTGGKGDGDLSVGSDGPAAGPRTPRITLSWPAPRWRVAWPSLASAPGLAPPLGSPHTAASAPPVPALHATPAVALPAPVPASAKPPDRY